MFVIFILFTFDSQFFRHKTEPSENKMKETCCHSHKTYILLTVHRLLRGKGYRLIPPPHRNSLDNFHIETEQFLYGPPAYHHGAP